MRNKFTPLVSLFQIRPVFCGSSYFTSGHYSLLSGLGLMLENSTNDKIMIEKHLTSFCILKMVVLK